MDHLIGQLGRGVGNIVAQQYGLGSEALDVTDDPTIAAFFATRNYPKYEHFVSSSEKALGVIYRFRKDSRMTTLVQLEDGLTKLGHYTDGRGGVGWFGTRVPRNGPSDLLANAEALLDQYGREELILFSQPIIVEYEALLDYLLTALETGLKLSPRDLRTTRIGRQRGGFIRPPIHFRSVVPARRTLDTGYLTRYREYSPGIAVVEEPIAVEDTMALPGMESFFFRHSAEQIENPTREELWPPSVYDELYERLLELCLLEPTVSEYLTQHDTWAEDPEKGVIDRGFYTGAEEYAWQARLAQRDGDLDRAVHLIDTAFRVESSAEHYALRASVAYERGRPEEALRDLDSALSMDPECWPAAASQTAILVQQGHLDHALSLVTDAIIANPGRVELQMARAHLYAQLSRPELVVADCDEALKHIGIRIDGPRIEVELLSLKALALTDWGKDAEAEEVVEQLEGRIETNRLRQHIVSMRASRATPS